MYHLICAVSLLQLSRAYVEFPSSCVGESNGYQWIKPLEGDSYPPINQKCDSEYMIIDVNRDDNVKAYFSSFESWHYALSGPALSDSANWEHWWLPAAQLLEDSPSDFIEEIESNLLSEHVEEDEIDDIVNGVSKVLDTELPDYDDVQLLNKQYFRFVLSPDCSSCAGTVFDVVNNRYSLSNDDQYGDRTAYYMTGDLFGCQSQMDNLADCSWDYDSYRCSFCTVEASDGDLGYHRTDFPEIYRDETTQLGLCGVYPQSTYSQKVPHSKTECMTSNGGDLKLKPSIGTDGRFCVCYKPQQSYDTDIKWRSSPSSYEKYAEEWVQKQEAKLIEAETSDSTNDEVYELYQSDFEDGTYRITQSGTYYIMEDITFDFNAGNLESPNSGDSWWPRVDQDEYPGAGMLRNEYFMGFFAGITVEADDVVIDLKGHSLAMSQSFYFQQRFFSVIALKSVVFPLNQGPGEFGTNPVYPSNVVIRNGEIGLSSHHGIHGHYNKDVVIEDVHIYDFETHGIEMSYFQNLKIQNVEIGPSSKMAFLKGEYAFARLTLQRLERLRDSTSLVTQLAIADAFPIAFDGRDDEVSMNDVIGNLQSLMDIAFKSVMNLVEYEEDDPLFMASKDLFIEETGIPSGGAMYGLFLNQFVANIAGPHPSMKHSKDAVIENVQIHDLDHSTTEYLRLDQFQNGFYRNPFGAALSAHSVLGKQMMSGQMMDWSSVKYKGDALMDAFIALDVVTDDEAMDWREKGEMMIGSEFVDWTMGLHQWSNDEEEAHPHLGCNNDAMTMVPKGVVGVRMDGVENVNFKKLDIYNLYESSDIGSIKCGDYWDGDFSDFEGGGHFYQKTPYLYGYSGNMVHGVMSDWSTFSMESDINIHHIYSETGLVRGIGLYTQSLLTFYDDDEVILQDPITEPEPATPAPAYVVSLQNEVEELEMESEEMLIESEISDSMEMKSKSVIGKVPDRKQPSNKGAKAPINKGPMMKAHRRLGDDHDLIGKPVHSKSASSAELTVSSNIEEVEDEKKEKAKDEKEKEKPKPDKVAKLKWNDDKTKLIVADAENPEDQKVPDPKNAQNAPVTEALQQETNTVPVSSENKEVSAPQPKAKSGGFDTRTAEEQLVAGQGAKQSVATESESDLPPTNPYKDPNLNGIPQPKPDSKGTEEIETETEENTVSDDPELSEDAKDQKPKPKKSETANVAADDVVDIPTDSELTEVEMASDGKPKPPNSKQIEIESETESEEAIESEIDIQSESQSEAVSVPQPKSVPVAVEEEAQNEIQEPVSAQAESAEIANDGKPKPPKNPPSKQASADTVAEIEVVEEVEPPVIEHEVEQQIEPQVPTVNDQPDLAGDGKPKPPKKEKENEKPNGSPPEQPELADDGKPKPPPPDDAVTVNKPTVDTPAVPESIGTESVVDSENGSNDISTIPDVAVSNEPEGKSPVNANKPETEVDAVDTLSEVEEEETVSESEQENEESKEEEEGESEHKANVTGKDPEEKKAEDAAKKEALENAAPEPKEPKEAPEPKEPAGNQDDEDDVAEVEWPEVPEESETKYGIPDYAQSGWEGDDIGNVDGFGSDDHIDTVDGIDDGEDQRSSNIEDGDTVQTEPQIPEPQPVSAGDDESESEQNEITKPVPKETNPNNDGENEEEGDTESEEVVNRMATNLNLYYLIAGPAMYEQDTLLLDHPYAPAEAKPFHVVESWSLDDDHVFISKMINAPATLKMSCVFGRDGTKNDVDDLGEIQNRDCDNKQLFRMQQQQMSSRMDVATVSDTVSNNGRKKWNFDSWIWSAIMASTLVMLMAVIYVFARCRRKTGKELDVPSLEDCYHSERAPLTASTDLYAHYGSQWRKRHY